MSRSCRQVASSDLFRSLPVPSRLISPLFLREPFSERVPPEILRRKLLLLAQEEGDQFVALADCGAGLHCHASPPTPLSHES